MLRCFSLNNYITHHVNIVITDYLQLIKVRLGLRWQPTLRQRNEEGEAKGGINIRARGRDKLIATLYFIAYLLNYTRPYIIFKYCY